MRCYSCGHRCKILEGLKGICKVRYNEGGVLKVPRGYVAALHSERGAYARRIVQVQLIQHRLNGSGIMPRATVVG